LKYKKEKPMNEQIFFIHGLGFAELKIEKFRELGKKI